MGRTNTTATRIVSAMRIFMGGLSSLSQNGAIEVSMPEVTTQGSGVALKS